MTCHRYAPELAFPAYAFVPNRHPHPVTDPQGHQFGLPEEACEPLDPNQPDTSREYLFAIDLFNAGYYWEAHEAWEGLWIAAGRQGLVADFLKGLIKLAAAGVKAREGQANGVVRHATRAAELFQQVSSQQPETLATFAGLNLNQLLQQACWLASQPVVDDCFTVEGRPVLKLTLSLSIS